jgi:urease accessory protein
MVWHAQLSVTYRQEAGRTVSSHSHSGPLRVLQSLYPEGPGVCHQTMIHPPGGLLGGDVLNIALHAQSATHAVLTTPGAARFYRSDGEAAHQKVQLTLDEDARLEWLPMEAICHSACVAHNSLSLALAPGAQMIGWDITALGLPAAAQPFVAGELTQTLHWPGVWLEQARISAQDTALLDGPLGLNGQRCMATMWLASGTPLLREQREALLDAARALASDMAAPLQAGCTSPHAQLVLVRALAPMVEPCQSLLRAVRDAWRPLCWGLPAHRPRIWSM